MRAARYRQLNFEFMQDDVPPANTSWRETVTACLRSPGALTPWEMGFLANLLRVSRPSQKQQGILSLLAGRVLPHRNLPTMTTQPTQGY